MPDTRFTRLTGASLPLQLASMPGVSTPALVAAVAEAGGVGMLPAPMMSPEALEAAFDEIESRTTGVVGVNFLMPFLAPSAVAAAARRARLVEFFYDDPDPGLVDQVHAEGALAFWQVGSLAEAEAAEAAGCDLIVVQGTEAGGHVRGGASLFPLLSAVLERVSIPVLAAGGIATARDVAAARAAGAAGVRVGTRFIASVESGAHPDYKKAILAARAEDTCLTEAFSVMWPDAPHRVLRSAIEAASALPDGVLGEIRVGGESVPIERFSVVCPSTETTGRIDAMALYAGESVANVHAIEPAAEILRELMRTG